MSKAATGAHKRLITSATDDRFDPQGGSSLIPMLVSGLVMIVIGMLIVAAIS